jgi:hypothetical protein
VILVASTHRALRLCLDVRGYRSRRFHVQSLRARVSAFLTKRLPSMKKKKKKKREEEEESIQLPVTKRRPLTHPSRRKPIPLCKYVYL